MKQLWISLIVIIGFVLAIPSYYAQAAEQSNTQLSSTQDIQHSTDQNNSMNSSEEIESNQSTEVINQTNDNKKVTNNDIPTSESATNMEHNSQTAPETSTDIEHNSQTTPETSSDSKHSSQTVQTTNKLDAETNNTTSNETADSNNHGTLFQQADDRSQLQTSSPKKSITDDSSEQTANPSSQTQTSQQHQPSELSQTAKDNQLSSVNKDKAQSDDKAIPQNKSTRSMNNETQTDKQGVTTQRHTAQLTETSDKHLVTLSAQQPVKTTQNKQQAKTKASATQVHKILHTNDVHGRFVEDKGKVIGMPKLKGIKDQESPDLLVDSGDAFQGLPVSNNSKGEEMAKAMNSVGYDAMTLGNHEFDFGYDQLLKLKKQLNFPMVTSNVYRNGKRDFEPSTIVNKNGVRYGIIGVTTPETKTKTSPNAIKDVEFKDPLTSVKAAINDIKPQVDVFVILAHLGIDPNTKKEWRGDYLTEQLSKDKSIKQSIIVLDGHSHTVIEHGKTYGNDILAQTGTALAHVGRISFNRDHGKTTNLKADLIDAEDTLNIKADPTIEQQVNKANDAFLKSTSTVVVPNNQVILNGERNIARTQETNLGNLITDAMEAYATKNFKHRPDFAVTNGGGIRASIDKGKVTQNDIITVLPFGNLISQISVKGSDVKKAFEHSLSAPTETKDGKAQLTANGGFLQVSKSIRLSYDLTKKSGERVTEIQVLNHDTGKFEQLDPNKTYHVTTNDFTASKGDGYDMFGGAREEGISLDEVVANYVKNTDLTQYNTTEPQRLIQGQLPALESSNIKHDAASSTSNQHAGQTSGGTLTQMPEHKVQPINTQYVPSKEHNSVTTVQNNSKTNEFTKQHSSKGDKVIAFNPRPSRASKTDQLSDYSYEINHSNYKNTAGNKQVFKDEQAIERSNKSSYTTDAMNRELVNPTIINALAENDILDATHTIIQHPMKLVPMSTQLSHFYDTNNVNTCILKNVDYKVDNTNGAFSHLSYVSNQGGQDASLSTLPNTGDSEHKHYPVAIILMLSGAGLLYYRKKITA